MSSKSRYASAPVVGKGYGTLNFPSRAGGLVPRDLLRDVGTFDYTISVGDRADHLAARFWNDSTLWWLICLSNDIAYPFSSGGFTPGVTLRIAKDPQQLLDKLNR